MNLTTFRNDARYLKLDGSNANTNIDIGSYDFTTLGTLEAGTGAFSTGVLSDTYSDYANIQWGSTDGSTFSFDMDVSTGGSFTSFDILADNYYDQNGNNQWGVTDGAGNFEFYGAVTVDTTTLVVNASGYANKVGIGTNAPDSIFHIKANVAGTVGSHPAGQLIIQDPDDTVFGNAVITGYESDGAGNPDQQLWYLGSSSSSNSNIIFLNRRNSSLQLGTNGVSRLTILGNGNVGILVTDPDATLEILDTTTQLKLSYDATNYFTFTTQSDGDLTLDSNKAGYDLDFGDGNLTTTGKITGAEVEINGNLNHDGANVGFFGVAPTARSTGWAVTNEASDKVYDANATTVDEIADVLGTLIEEFKAKGLLGA